MKAYEAYVELEKALEIVEAHKLDQAAEMIRTGLDYIWLHLADEEIKRLERMKKWPGTSAHTAKKPLTKVC